MEKYMLNRSSGVGRVKTVKVSNVSLGASERDIKEFFSFSGDIEYVEMQSDTERSQIAYVTFNDSQGADTAKSRFSLKCLFKHESLIDRAADFTAGSPLKNSRSIVGLSRIRGYSMHQCNLWLLSFLKKNYKTGFWVIRGKLNYSARYLLLHPPAIGGYQADRNQSTYFSLAGNRTLSRNFFPASLTIRPQIWGATIVDMSVTVTLDPVYQLPPTAFTASVPTGKKSAGNSESAFQKAEDVVSSMLAKGYILGKDAVGKAKSFDEKHQLTSTATAKVASLDKKIGLTEKISIGTSIVNDKVREVDQKLQVSDKAKSAFSAAEQKVSTAGSAIMKNRYVLTGTTWVAGAFSKVAKAAGEVGQMTKEKVGMTEDEQRQKMVTDFAQVHLSESPIASEFTEHQPAKPAPAQGLVL
ncbi:hypothetical protein H5410_043055 [Solanum commersonii]|uniref:RRM domain-containing protein n=3 Tax=Magnoliopsida TaxID=3398 RepID=A0A9J5XXE1_SOLCO|nr:hypothetical protein H5410_043055 [Solanum commersonii]